MEPKEPDDEPDEQQLAAVQRLLEREAAADVQAIVQLYGALPAWVPKPVTDRIGHSLAILRNAKQVPDRITEIVAAHRRQADGYDVPGTALDATAFITAIDYLAHVQWALEQGQERALMEMAGSDSAFGRHIQQQRQLQSLAMNEDKKVQARAKEQNWLAIGRPLRTARPVASDRWLAEQIAKRSSDPASTIRAALPRLGLSRPRKENG